jgi:NAD(P)H-flavin reductase
MQVFATSTAIVREMSYPQLHFRGWFSWISLFPTGRIIVIACYLAIIAYMVSYKAVANDAYYYERMGFRAAWISVTQVPFVYLLSSKANIIGWLIGSSHERLNWLHRWVSRTLLITVTIHGAFFMAEWVRADFVKIELKMMPMVKYGLGAWGVLVWTFLSSLSPMRRMAYEVFVMQHIAAAGVFLWLLYVHVPAYANYNVWFAIAAASFDWVLRGLLMIYRNLRVRASKSCSGGQRIGHEVELQAIGSDLTIVTIKDVHLSWKPGQHLYLWLPYLGILESHPFTIASPYDTENKCHCNEIQLAIRAHGGISKRMHKYASKSNISKGRSLTGFIAGPYGVPPSWQAYESLVLVSASTGASYTLPILESLLSCSSTTICTQRIAFLLVVRDRPHAAYYEERLSKAFAQAEARGIELDIEIAVTGDASSIRDSDVTDEKAESNESIRLNSDDNIDEISPNKDEPYILVKPNSKSISASSQAEASSSGKGCCCNKDERPSPCCANFATQPSKQIVFSYSRPDISTFIQKVVEVTGGETSVGVCGGKSLVATVRNSVARLSDERAVHKGTGAQGIHLHVEEYCF